MRFTKMSKTLLLGGALALSLNGCKDDKANTTTDGGGSDAGRDSGYDAGYDAGPPPPPALLRVAHLATGSGLGAGGLLHLCAYSADDDTRLLVTSDALATGDFTMATVGVPLRPGGISVHFAIPATVIGALGNRVVEVWRASDLTLTFQGLPLCNPIGSATALASVALGGSGPNDITLVPGESSTVAIVGGDGSELLATGPKACIGGSGAVDCPPVSIVTLADERTTTATTEAHVRIVNADGRFTAPGVCYDTIDGQAPTYTAITTTLATYVGLAAPAYEDITPLGALDIGGGTLLDRFVTLHPAAGPTATTCDTSVTSPTIAGTIPNAGLIAQFASQAAAGAATVRDSLEAGAVTTMFIAPLTLQFRDVTFNGGSGVCSVLDPSAVSCPKCNANPATAASCRPVEPCDWTVAEFANCVTIPVSIPVADSNP